MEPHVILEARENTVVISIRIDTLPEVRVELLWSTLFHGIPRPSRSASDPEAGPLDDAAFHRQLQVKFGPLLAHRVRTELSSGDSTLWRLYRTVLDLRRLCLEAMSVAAAAVSMKFWFSGNSLESPYKYRIDIPHSCSKQEPSQIGLFCRRWNVEVRGSR